MDVPFNIGVSFFIFIVILGILFVMLQRSTSDIQDLGIITDPKEMSTLTPPEIQPDHVTIECESVRTIGDKQRYDYKINVNDLGIFSQDKYDKLLPLFIFKGSVIAADKIKKGDTYVNSVEGVAIPDLSKADPKESTYSFYSLPATSVSDFGSIETIIITFVSAKNKCKLAAAPRADPLTTDFSSLNNIEDFMKECGSLLKGVISVRALNKCVIEGPTADIINLEVTSVPLTEESLNNIVSFKISAISPISETDKIKIEISCNTKENIYIPESGYVQADALEEIKYTKILSCDTTGTIKICVDKDEMPGCDDESTISSTTFVPTL